MCLGRGGLSAASGMVAPQVLQTVVTVVAADTVVSCRAVNKFDVLIGSWDLSAADIALNPQFETK